MACTLAGTCPPFASASPLSRAKTQEGYALAYDLRFQAAYEVLADAEAADPEDPAPPRAIAAVTWMEALFAQGVATFEAFGGEISRTDVKRPVVSPAIADRFGQNITKAAMLAHRQSTRSDDADAQYQVGATAALLAVYGATVEGRTLGSLRHGRAAVSAMRRARELDPQRRETALVLGMSQYTMATMSWPVRVLARLSGLSGDRETALALLNEAATPGTETESDALLLLMIVDSRERRHADALPRLQRLQQRHPRNRLFWLNDGAAALLAGQPERADVSLSRGIAVQAWTAGPTVLGEPALWFAHRGTARARLDRGTEAERDLASGLASSPRDWVRGRIHAQLGRIAVVAGDVERARREFVAALEFSQRGGDRGTSKEAKDSLDATGK
jgi:tetratricopeptide (TPR) repeat protein